MGVVREVQAGNKSLKSDYVAFLMWCMGRAIQAAARVDKDIEREFAELPEQFTFDLSVMPRGPHMIVGKNKRGHVRYLGWDPEGKKIDLRMKIKHIEAAMLLFTFQESTAIAACRNRFVVDGNVGHTCTVVRILSAVEVYLLPKVLAARAVKRYPQWSFWKKYAGRAQIYLRTLLGV